MVWFMSTPYAPVAIDTRGSLSIPMGIKNNLGITPGSTMLVRQINGVILLVPYHGEVVVASGEDRLHAWVDEQLTKALPPAPLQPSKMAVAESLRIQGSRERHAQRMAALQEQSRLMELRIEHQRQLRTRVMPPELTADEHAALLKDIGAQPAESEGTPL